MKRSTSVARSPHNRENSRPKARLAAFRLGAGHVMYGRPPLGKDFFIVSASGSGAVMYPACLRGAWTAGPEGVRGRAPRSSMRARGAMTFAECPDPVSDRFAVTSKLPLRSWTRVTRSTNSIRGVDAQSIHTLFIGQPYRRRPYTVQLLHRRAHDPRRLACSRRILARRRSPGSDFGGDQRRHYAYRHRPHPQRQPSVADGNMLIDGAGSTVTVAGLTGVGILEPGALTISNGGVLNSQSVPRSTPLSRPPLAARR